MEDIFLGTAIKDIMFLSYYIRSKILNASYISTCASYLII